MKLPRPVCPENYRLRLSEHIRVDIYHRLRAIQSPDNMHQPGYKVSSVIYWDKLDKEGIADVILVQ